MPLLERTSWQAERPCRFCGSHHTRLEGVVREFAFLRCRQCEFTFAPAADADDAVERCRDIDRLRVEGLPGVGWADARFLDPAFSLLPKRKLEVLDFGTGQSVVPDLIRCDGHRVVAVDVAPPLRSHPDRLTGDIFELPLSRRTFDLVYAFQVFEHLPEPRPIFARLLELTRPGGILAIHTDMETEERNRGFENWWYVLPPHHCSFYRHTTFLRAVEATPQRVVHTEPKMVCIERGE